MPLEKTLFYSNSYETRHFIPHGDWYKKGLILLFEKITLGLYDAFNIQIKGKINNTI